MLAVCGEQCSCAGAWEAHAPKYVVGFFEVLEEHVATQLGRRVLVLAAQNAQQIVFSSCIERSMIFTRPPTYHHLITPRVDETYEVNADRISKR